MRYKQCVLAYHVSDRCVVLLSAGERSTLIWYPSGVREGLNLIVSVVVSVCILYTIMLP